MVPGMNINALKLILATVVAVVLIVAILINGDNTLWAVPLLSLLVGYVIGNAKFTDREGATAPIVSV